MKWIRRHKIWSYWIVWATVFISIELITVNHSGIVGEMYAALTWITFIPYLVIIKLYEKVAHGKANRN